MPPSDIEKAGMKVLIVDDEPQFLALVELSLRTMGIVGECVTAVDGEDAYKILSQHQLSSVDNNFQFICCDINMPKVTGIEFLSKIRSKEKYKNIPVLMLTSETAIQTVSQCIKAGCSNYLIKPWPSEEAFVEKFNASWDKHHKG